MTLQEKIYAGLMVLLLVAAMVGVYRVATLGSDEDDYHIICLGGHQYYRANFMAKGFLGIKLDANGNPIGCEVRG